MPNGTSRSLNGANLRRDKFAQRRKVFCCSILSDRHSKENPLWGCSSAGRAPALQAGGHGFDSHHLHHPTKGWGQNPSGFEVIENRIKRRRVEKTDREDKDLDRVDKIDATRNRSFQSRVKQFHREVEVQSKVKRIRPFYCEKPVFRNSSNSKRKNVRTKRPKGRQEVQANKSIR